MSELEPPGGLPAPPSGGEVPIALVRVGRTDRWRRLAWGALLLVGAVALLQLARSVRAVSVPLLIAFILAYLASPIVDRLERRGFRRTVAVILLLVLLVAVGGLATVTLGPLVGEELEQVPDKLGAYRDRAVEWADERLGIELPGSPKEVAEAASRQLENGEGGGSSPLATAQAVIGAIYGGTIGLFGLVLGVVLVPVLAFYLLRDLPRILAFVGDLVPRAHRAAVFARMREVDEAVGAFFRGQLLVALILAALYAAGLWWVGLPLAVPVAIASGLGNMVPYLGTGTGLLVATLLALLEGDLSLVLAVWGVFAAVQGLEGWLITPRVIGNSVGLPALAVIVSLMVFGDLFGILGLLLAVPVAAVLRIALRDLLVRYRGSSFYNEPV